MSINRKQTTIGWASMLVLMFCVPGCSTFSFSSKKQVQQLESENNRLLSEFRAERQRRETAERTAQQLEMRLAESEKMLARQIQSTTPGRLSSLPSAATPQTPLPSLNDGNQNFPAEGDFQWQRRVK